MEKGRKLVPDIDKIHREDFDHVIVKRMSGNEEKNSEEILEIQEDAENYRYYLTLKGFILYLLGNPSNSNVNKVIKALRENRYTQDDYPFLWYHNIFDAIYGKNFNVKILKKIAVELQTQLDTQDNKFLKYWIIKQYRSEMLYFNRDLNVIYHPISYWSSLKPFLEKREDNDINLSDISSKLRDYDREMLSLLLKYQDCEIKLTRKLLAEFS